MPQSSPPSGRLQATALLAAVARLFCLPAGSKTSEEAPQKSGRRAHAPRSRECRLCRSGWGQHERAAWSHAPPEIRPRFARAMVRGHQPSGPAGQSKASRPLKAQPIGRLARRGRGGAERSEARGSSSRLLSFRGPRLDSSCDRKGGLPRGCRCRAGSPGKRPPPPRAPPAQRCCIHLASKPAPHASP